MSLSVDAIVILDIVPRLVWSNSRNMVRNDGGEFFFRRRAAFHAPIDQQRNKVESDRQPHYVLQGGQPVR